jgi:hypothetical protein
MTSVPKAIMQVGETHQSLVITPLDVNKGSRRCGAFALGMKGGR